MAIDLVPKEVAHVPRSDASPVLLDHHLARLAHDEQRLNHLLEAQHGALLRGERRASNVQALLLLPTTHHDLSCTEHTLLSLRSCADDEFEFRSFGVHILWKAFDGRGIRVFLHPHRRKKAPHRRENTCQRSSLTIGSESW